MGNNGTWLPGDVRHSGGRCVVVLPRPALGSAAIQSRRTTSRYSAPTVCIVEPAVNFENPRIWATKPTLPSSQGATPPFWPTCRGKVHNFAIPAVFARALRNIRSKLHTISMRMGFASPASLRLARSLFSLFHSTPGAKDEGRKGWDRGETEHRFFSSGLVRLS